MLMNTQILITYCFAAFKFAVSSPCQRIRDLGVGLQSALIVSRRTCGNLFLVHRGNCGPLDTASGPSVHSIGRNRSVGRSRSLWRSICAPGWTAPGSLSLSLHYRQCLSLFPLSFPPPPQQSCANPTIGTVARGRRRFLLRGRREPERGSGNIVVSARVSALSERVRCLPLLPLINVALSLSPFLSPMKEVSAAKTVETAG